MSSSTNARGYGMRHQRLRAHLLPLAYGTPCPRCGEVMLEGQRLELGHTDDRSGYSGIEHAVCNQRAGARRSAELARMRRRYKVNAPKDAHVESPYPRSRDW